LKLALEVTRGFSPRIFAVFSLRSWSFAGLKKEPRYYIGKSFLLINCGYRSRPLLTDSPVSAIFAMEAVKINQSLKIAKGNLD
jgi:hypothetical protein